MVTRFGNLPETWYHDLVETAAICIRATSTLLCVKLNKQEQITVYSSTNVK